MSLQIIKSVAGKDEYVLLPITVYKALKNKIEKKLAAVIRDNDYIPFDPSDYVDNPVALARIRAHVTQVELAKRLQVSQAYISKVERQRSVNDKLLKRVRVVLKK